MNPFVTPMCLLALSLSLLLNGGAAAQPATVGWNDERLTVHALDVPLKELVDEVVRVTGIRATGVERLSGRRTVEVRDEPLLAALAVLLDGVNHLITVDGTTLHVHIHSMAGAAPPPAAGTGPIIIPGLSDPTPEQNTVPPQPGDLDEDENEQDELVELEQTIAAGGPTAVAAMIAAVRSEYASVRIRALHALAATNKDVGIPRMAAALSDEDPEVARSAADLLANIPDRKALDALAAQLKPNAPVDTQAAALRGLALRADLESIPQVRRAAGEAHPLVRPLAATLLQELENRQRAQAAAASRR